MHAARARGVRVFNGIYSPMLAAVYYIATEHDLTHEKAWPGMPEFFKLHLLQSLT